MVTESLKEKRNDKNMVTSLVIACIAVCDVYIFLSHFRVRYVFGALEMKQRVCVFVTIPFGGMQSPYGWGIVDLCTVVGNH